MERVQSQDDASKKGRSSSGEKLSDQGIDDIKKQLSGGGVNREEILVQIKDLEKEQLKERIVSLELANQQLLRRNALLVHNFEKLRMNLAVLKAKLEIAFEDEALGQHTSFVPKDGRTAGGRRISDDQGPYNGIPPKVRGLTISQFRDDWKKGVSVDSFRVSSSPEERGGSLDGSPPLTSPSGAGHSQENGKGALKKDARTRKSVHNEREDNNDKVAGEKEANGKGGNRERTPRKKKQRLKDYMDDCDKGKDFVARVKTLKNELVGDMVPAVGDEHLDGIVLSMNESATSKKIMRVRAGTAGKLLERLTYTAAPDPDYVADFILTFTRFMKPADVLEFLCIRFLHAKGQGDEQVVRLRVVNVFKIWLERNSPVLLKRDKLVQRMNEFLNVLMSKSGMITAASTIKNLLDRVTKEMEGLADLELVVNQRASIIKKGDFAKMKEEQLGSQLTLIHYQLWAAITPDDFLTFAQDKSSTAPDPVQECQTATSKLVFLSAAIRRWVELEFSCRDIDEGLVLVKLLNIAEHCYQFKNYNGVFDIMAALRHTLKDRTEDVLKGAVTTDSKKKGIDVTVVYNKLLRFTSEKNNFENYRTTLSQQNLPSVPYFGAVTHRLATLRNHPDRFTQTEYINFDKLHELANIMKEIQTYQKVRYTIQPLKAAREYLLEVLQLKVKQ